MSCCCTRRIRRTAAASRSVRMNERRIWRCRARAMRMQAAATGTPMSAAESEVKPVARRTAARPALETIAATRGGSGRTAAHTMLSATTSPGSIDSRSRKREVSAHPRSTADEEAAATAKSASLDRRASRAAMAPAPAAMAVAASETDAFPRTAPAPPLSQYTATIRVMAATAASTGTIQAASRARCSARNLSRILPRRSPRLLARRARSSRKRAACSERLALGRSRASSPTVRGGYRKADAVGPCGQWPRKDAHLPSRRPARVLRPAIAPRSG